MKLQQRNESILDKFADGYITVLIDHTYNRINLYETIGLQPEKDLGSDYLDWFTDDLFMYIELDKEELLELIEKFTFY
jgi:hypothetical protein